MAEIQSHRNFKRTMHKGGVNQGNPNVASGDIVAAQEEAMSNQYGFVGTAERESLGIKPEENTRTIRNPEYYMKMGEGVNRWRQFERENPGARVIEDKDGRNPLDGTMDLLVAYPRVHDETRQAQMQAALDADQKILYQTEDAGYPYVESDSSNWAADAEVEFDRSDKEAIERLKQQNRHFYRSNSIMGGNSPTAGKTYAEATAMYTDAEIEAHEAQYSKRKMSSPMDSESWQKLIMQAKPPTSFNFGDTGFENPNSALNQARRNRQPATARH